jgi:uncharacterized protein YaeQ
VGSPGKPRAEKNGAVVIERYAERQLESPVCDEARDAERANEFATGRLRHHGAPCIDRTRHVGYTPAMAQTATVYTFDIQLADVDRGVYEALALRVARHPSETEEFLWTRVLAYCLEYAEGITFSKGLSEPDEPAVVVRDLTGALQAWIEVGAPDAARLHKASKASPRVVVYTHREPRILQRGYVGERIHRGEAIALCAIDRHLLAALVARLDRRMKFDLSVSESTLYIDIGSETLSGELTRHPLTPAEGFETV